MHRRPKTFAILLQLFAAVLACVTTAVPAAARRSPTPAIVATHAHAQSIAQRHRAIERRPAARPSDARRDGPPPAPFLPSVSRNLVVRDAGERTPFDVRSTDEPARASIDHPTARGPPR
jgi:hypothetical protein